MNIFRLSFLTLLRDPHCSLRSLTHGVPFLRQMSLALSKTVSNHPNLLCAIKVKRMLATELRNHVVEWAVAPGLRACFTPSGDIASGLSHWPSAWRQTRGMLLRSMSRGLGAGRWRMAVGLTCMRAGEVAPVSSANHRGFLNPCSCLG